MEFALQFPCPCRSSYNNSLLVVFATHVEGLRRVCPPTLHTNSGSTSYRYKPYFAFSGGCGGFLGGRLVVERGEVLLALQIARLW